MGLKIAEQGGFRRPQNLGTDLRSNTMDFDGYEYFILKEYGNFIENLANKGKRVNHWPVYIRQGLIIRGTV